MKLKHEKYTLELSSTRRIASGSFDSKDNILVNLFFENMQGIGEAVPIHQFNEDYISIDSWFDSIQEDIPANPEEIKSTADLLSEKRVPNSVIAAIDMCLYDIMGKIKRTSLYSMLGLFYIPQGPVSKTIYINTPEKMIEQAIRFKGYPVIKLKINSEMDLDMVKKIHDASGYSKLIIDSNEGWGVDEAIDKIRFLKKHEYILFFEQPIRARNLSGLEEIKRKVNASVFLDEDIITLKDLDDTRGLVDGVSLKIQKCGGIYKTIEMITRARKNNFKVLLSSYTESAISITAASHLIPLVDFIDLDGNIYVTNEKYSGAYIDAKGNMIIPSRPGIGLTAINALH